MKDMTERGKDVLEMVDAIFAEDTRVTQVLLNLLGIKKSYIKVKNSMKLKLV